MHRSTDMTDRPVDVPRSKVLRCAELVVRSRSVGFMSNTTPSPFRPAVYANESQNQHMVDAHDETFPTVHNVILGRADLRSSLALFPDLGLD